MGLRLQLAVGSQSSGVSSLRLVVSSGAGWLVVEPAIGRDWQFIAGSGQFVATT